MQKDIFKTLIKEGQESIVTTTLTIEVVPVWKWLLQ